LELGAKIWELRRRGLSRFEVSKRFGIPMEHVTEILEQFQSHFYPDVGAALHHYATLDDARLESLMARWLPIATGPALEVVKMTRHGSCIQLDHETPARAAAIVLGAIKARVQLLLACRPEGANGGKDGGGGTNLLVWLQNVMPGIQKVVTAVEGTPVSRPRQTLDLECEAETEAEKNSNGAKP
jgi:hypothetical protein